MCRTSTPDVQVNVNICPAEYFQSLLFTMEYCDTRKIRLGLIFLVIPLNLSLHNFILKQLCT